MSVLPFQTNIPNVHMKNCYSWCIYVTKTKRQLTLQFVLRVLRKKIKEKHSYIKVGDLSIHAIRRLKSHLIEDLIKTNEKKILLSFSLCLSQSGRQWGWCHWTRYPAKARSSCTPCRINTWSWLNLVQGCKTWTAKE